MLRQLYFLISFLCTLISCFRVNPQNSMFVDQYKRNTVYHGVNVVYKIHPFHPDLNNFSTNFSLTDQDLMNLRGWGMNSIRLHCAWQGVEPEKRVYNYTYIETIKAIVKKCNKYGIVVLLDAHQDLFVRQFCGQGLPTWAAKRQSFPAPLKANIRYDDKGFPLIEDCLKVQFTEYYFTYDVMKLQKDFFTNQRGLLDHFSKFWETIAAYMSDEPNIIGYQFINQPMGYDIFVDPGSTLLPGEVNDKFLLPAYKKIYEAIRKVDKETLIFFEPSTVDLLGGGFFETPGGEKELDKQVYSYHVYCPSVTKSGETVSQSTCNIFDSLTVESKQQNLRKLKIGGFMTQFGGLSNTDKSMEELTRLINLMESNFRSWTYWQFKYYNDITTNTNPATTEALYDEKGNLQQLKVKTLARPYAYAICGQPISQTLKKGIFRLEWIGSNLCYNKNTELFLSEKYYFPKKFKINFSKNCHSCSISLLKGQESNFYEVFIDYKSIGKKIVLNIIPN